MAEAATETSLETTENAEIVGEEDEPEIREPPPSYDTVAQKNNFFPDKKDGDAKEPKKETKKEKKVKKKLLNLGKNNKPFRISFYRLVNQFPFYKLRNMFLALKKLMASSDKSTQTICFPNVQG